MLTTGHPAATVQALVAVVLPAYPELGEAERRRVEADVTGWVTAQILGMPTLLRVPYSLALRVFEWLPLLRYGRPFRRLPAAQRAAYLARWSEARLAPLRDVVKLMRSSSLLVYFDHALVVEHLEAERRRRRTPCEPPKAANE